MPTLLRLTWYAMYHLPRGRNVCFYLLCDLASNVCPMFENEVLLMLWVAIC